MLNKKRSTGGNAASRQFVGNTAPQRTRKWWLRNWRLRYKMAAVLIVPTLAALGVGGVRIYDGMTTSAQLNEVVEEVEIAQRAAAVTHELQRERDTAVVQLVDTGTPPDAYNSQAQQVDEAAAELRAYGDRVSDLDPFVADAYQDAAHRLDSLTALREVVNTGFTESQAMTAYGDIVETLLELNERIAISAAGTSVAENAHVAETVGNSKEQLAQMRSILLAGTTRDTFEAGEADAVRTADARLEAAREEFNKVATQQQQSRYSALVAGAAVDATEQMKQIALIADSDGRDLNIDSQRWGSQSAAYGDLLRSSEQEFYTEFHDGVEELAESTQWAALRDAAAVIAVLLLAFGIAIYIARSMLRPLRTLRYGALEIAQAGLPDAIKKVNDNPTNADMVSVPPVPVHSREEIGQVARSFDAVHQQALRLASEQALLRNNVNDLFVNLARRSQTLVQRQLSLIDRLEQDEQDPDQLSSLFELDHLATRMRRNNENLLILGGTDLTRRMMRPVPLAEVVGAAVSEVEQYARISTSDTPELAIQGRVVNDFVHLVAELLENATVFSNPDTEVNVRMAYRRQELVLEIRDRGVGIDSGEIGEINERLTKPPEIDVAVSRRMGLYVVSQLAARHNIRVVLQNNSDLEGGATATVHLSGEYVSQITPDGPIPMPDMHRVAPEDPRDRDPLTDTGNQLGLAAAFGGRGGGITDRGPDSAEQAPLPPLDTDSTSPGGSDQDRWEHTSARELEEFDTDGPVQVGPVETEEPVTNYSVQVSSGDSYGVSDIPRWEDEPAAPEPEPERTTGGESQYWPSEVGEPADETEYEGQCAPPPGLDGPADLFNSPFEAEKTTTIEAVSDFGWKDEPPEPEPESPAEQTLVTEAVPPVVDDAPPEVAPYGSTADEDVSETASSDAAAPRGAAAEMDDAPTQRLPIYEAVLSQWFRESSDPVDNAVDTAAGPASTRAPSRNDFSAGASSNGNGAAKAPLGAFGNSSEDVLSGGDPLGNDPAGNDPAGADPAGSDPAGSDPARVDPANGTPSVGVPSDSSVADKAPTGGTPFGGASWDGAGSSFDSAPFGDRADSGESVDEPSGGLLRDTGLPRRARRGQAEEPFAESGTGEPASESALSDPGWGSADVGWQAAEALVEQTKQAQETTSAGLPKRVPKSNLVPGSAASQAAPQAASKSAAPRSANAVRGRMSNFQQGIRRGRHAKAEPVSTEPPRSIPSRHEEQE
ncbi:sensor histidine kinase [Parasphingorhabdus pacifica]